MQANELRIGNYVKSLSVTQVRELTESTINGYSIGGFYPIPLTEELLLKCGFEKADDMAYHPDMKIRSLYINTLILRKNTCSNLFEFHFQHKNPAMFENTEIKYLHQLQNLYFALTGKELEVKL